ncbi:O-antigen ligase family protein [Coriobacteriia bacterium Es71-Z0120]|uniref:O-antigen ligase family protein n=1 Tax=Parvivirga hydrogeniphila TaxID=2939460 RepID=UPI002260FA20|nr:O-antigen ligase family protein [Parvivirga hydrogeniphila]MCL4079325.1 O-antigen ligase family protein [Parvivirga hydrogeniphila]
MAERVALALVLVAAFVSLRAAGDPYQPIRTLVVAASAVALLFAAPSAGGDRRWVVAVGVFLALLGVSAGVNGLPSAVWGVEGRFDGLVAWAVAAVAGIAGWRMGAARARDVARFAAVGVVAQTFALAAQTAAHAQPGGSFGNQAIAGGWLAVCVALAFAGGIAERGAWRTFLWGAAVLGAAGLGFAGSRGAWAGLAAALVAAVAVRRKPREVLFAGVLVAAVVLGAVVAGGEPAAKVSPASLSAGSASARLEIWRGSVALVADAPLLGAGPGRFLYAFPQYEPVEHARVEGLDVRADQAHSRPLHLAAEAGVPAALAWIAVFATAAFAGAAGAKKRSPHALVLLSGLAAYLGQAAFSVHAIEVDGLGWLLAGMLAGGGFAGATWQAPGRRTVNGARWAGVALGLAAVVLCAWHLQADVAYQHSVEAFERGDMRTALSLAERAVRKDPLTDVYRVACSDAAAYLGAYERAASRAIIEKGLELEPASYDLALARARLARIDGSPEAVDAHVAAASLYPMGIAVRREAIDVCLKAGRTEDAQRLASEILRVIPDDPQAASVVGAAAR